MKYKNVCCMLSAMLMLYPQCIQAETLPEYVSEEYAVEEAPLECPAAIEDEKNVQEENIQEDIQEAIQEAIQEEAIQEIVKEETAQEEEERGEVKNPEDNPNTEQADEEDQTESIEDIDDTESENDTTGENGEYEEEPVVKECEEEPESEQTGTDENRQGDTIEQEDTKSIPIQQAEVQEKEYIEETARLSLKLQSRPHPRVVLPNIRQLSANSGKVKPFIIVENPSSDSDSLEMILESKSRGILPQQVNKQKIDGKVHYTLPEIEEDDQYILRIKSLDSDDTYEETLVFSVNQSGTHFLYDKKKADVYLKEGFAPCIRLINIDTTEVVSCLVNGREVNYLKENDQIRISEGCLKEGKNQIIVAVRDQAGNISLMEPWEFIIAHPDQEIKEKNAALAEKSGNWWKDMVYAFAKMIAQLFKSASFPWR